MQIWKTRLNICLNQLLWLKRCRKKDQVTYRASSFVVKLNCAYNKCVLACVVCLSVALVAYSYTQKIGQPTCQSND
jgi:hypothetical protein